MSSRPSRSRRLAREAAYQALYMVHVGRSGPIPAIEAVLARQEFEGEAEEFLRNTVEGVREKVREVDGIIEPCLSKSWSLNRLAVSDLVALRIAVFELYFRPGMPPKVTITEAVELAKRYGNKESGSFVNGVLGTVLKNSPKAEWDPSLEDKLEVLEDEEPVSMPDEPDLGPEDLIEEDEPQVKAGSWVIKSDTVQE